MRVGLCVALLAVVILHSLGARAEAAEAAAGAYVPGSRRVGARITPPAGIHFQDDTCFYSGKIGGGIALPTGGLLVANLSATTWRNLPTTFRVTPAKIVGVNANDAHFDMSDFFLDSFIGWHTASRIAAAKTIRTKL